MQNLNATIVQTDLIWGKIEANLAHFNSLLSRISEPTDLIVLPEMFSTAFAVDDQSCAEQTEGIAFKWMKNKSASLEAVIVGSIFVVEGDAFYNRLIWMQPDGRYMTYDKRHLFRLAREHKKFSPGKKQLICDIKGWKLMPLICYDLRFPVWSKNTFKNNSYAYDCAIYIANWPGRRSFAWNSLLTARAIENQSYVIGVNRIGEDGNKIPHQGDSAIYNYRGRPVYACEPNLEEMKTIELNYQELIDFRNSFTVGLDWDDFNIVV